MARTHYNIVLIDGNFDHVDVRDDNGNLQPLDLLDLVALIPDLNDSAWLKSTMAESEKSALKLRQGERLSELKAQHKLELDGAALAINGEKEKNSLLGAKVIELTSKLEAAEKALAASREDFKEAKRLPRALPIFSNNAAAADGGLAPTDFYRNPSGQVMQVY